MEIALRRRLFPALLLAVPASCGGVDEAAAPAQPVTEAWVRLPAVAGRPGAAYFMLNGGEADDALIAVESPMAERVELHESIAGGGAMTMNPIQRVEVSANSTVAFEPGGKHAMLFGIDPGVTPGERITLDFRFESGRDMRVAAAAVAAGDPGPDEDKGASDR